MDKLGDDGYEAVFRATRGESIYDFFTALQDIDADIGIEYPLHSAFS
jgi:hypothetical protein